MFIIEDNIRGKQATVKLVDMTSVLDVSSYIRKVRNSKFNQMRWIINNGHILRKANYKISIIDTRRSESDFKKNVKRYIIYWVHCLIFYVYIGMEEYWAQVKNRYS